MALQLHSIPQVNLAPRGGYASPDLSQLSTAFFGSFDRAKKQAKEGEIKQTLASLGQDLTSGKVDYNTAAAKLLSLGELQGGLGLLKLGEEQKQRDVSLKAGQDFSRSLGGIFGGGAPAPAGGSAGTPVSSREGTVHVAETEEDVQRLERATGMNIAPDIDKVVRTVYGEAAGEGPTGQQAVAGTIMNRSRQSGMTPSAVVLAPNQFEPWNDPAARARMEDLDPNSPEYQRIASTIAPVMRGEAQDPTGGATHFYAPTAQAALGRSAPSWDDGSGQDIGNHRFFRQGYSGTPTRVAQADVPALGAQPTQFQIPGQAPAQVPASTPQSKLVQSIPQLVQAASNPSLPAASRTMANTLLTQALNESKLTDEEKEYVRAKAEGFGGNFMEFKTALKKAGAVNIQNKVDVAGQTEEEKAIGKSAGERAAFTMAAAGKASQNLVRLNDLEARLENIKSGKLAPAKATLSAWGKALGVNDETLRGIGLDPAAPGNTQALQAIVNRMVVEQIGSGGFPANNFSDADRAFLERTVVQLANDPRANKIIVETARRGAQLDQEKARLWQKFRKNNKGASYDDFELVWADTLAQLNVFGDLQKETEALGLGAQTNFPPSAGAIGYLRQNPGLAADFDAKYGKGAAERALRGN